MPLSLSFVMAASMPSNPHEMLLSECRDLFLEHLLEALHKTFDGMEKSLSELADKTTVYETRKRYLDARDMAVRHRDAIEEQFQRRLMSEFQARVEKTKDRKEVFELSL